MITCYYLVTIEPKFTTIAAARKEAGFSYVGAVSHSTKLMKTQKNRHEMTYGIYLAPADASGYNVCTGASKFCKEACLNMSGRNKIFTDNRIQNCRIKKTRMMMEHPEFMMDWIVQEIIHYRKVAEAKGYSFSIRINCTSDLDLTKFHTSKGKNLFELFPDVQFYDYTKIIRRIDQMKIYPNYDITYSYSGTNYNECIAALDAGVRVAMVFEKELPKTYRGIEVINGDLYDIRYLDPKNVIVGLVFKRVRGHIDLKNTPFVISLEDQYRNV
jgi:hypothetical protein